MKKDWCNQVFWLWWGPEVRGCQHVVMLTLKPQAIGSPGTFSRSCTWTTVFMSCRGLFSIDLSNPFRVSLCRIVPCRSSAFCFKTCFANLKPEIASNCFTTFILLRINDEPVFKNINAGTKKCILHLLLKSQPHLTKISRFPRQRREPISKAMQFPSVWLLRWKKRNVKSTGNFNTANQRVENQKLQKTLPKASYLFASLLLGAETWWLKLQSAHVQSLVGSE